MAYQRRHNGFIQGRIVIPAFCPANTSSPATNQEVLETNSESVVIALTQG